MEVTNLGQNKIPIGFVTLRGPDVCRTYAPQPDITAYEVALLLNLAVMLMNGRGVGGIPDWETYLKEHNLERHFGEPV